MKNMICLSIVCLFIYLSVCLFVYLSDYLSVNCLFICLSVCLFVCLFICLCVYLSLCLSICLSICLSTLQVSRLAPSRMMINLLSLFFLDPLELRFLAGTSNSPSLDRYINRKEDR